MKEKSPVEHLPYNRAIVADLGGTKFSFFKEKWRDRLVFCKEERGITTKIEVYKDDDLIDVTVGNHEGIHVSASYDTTGDLLCASFWVVRFFKNQTLDVKVDPLVTRTIKYLKKHDSDILLRADFTTNEFNLLECEKVSESPAPEVTIQADIPFFLGESKALLFYPLKNGLPIPSGSLQSGREALCLTFLATEGDNTLSLGFKLNNEMSLAKAFSSGQVNFDNLDEWTTPKGMKDILASIFIIA